MALGIVEQLTHSTVRIECTLANGSSSCGTGFFMHFLKNGDMSFPVIVTNKHVIAGAKVGYIHLTFADEKGGPNLGSYQRCTLNDFEQQWVLHPDPNVDLAVLPIFHVLEGIRESTGKSCFFIGLDAKLIATSAQREAFSAMEDVVMIGYPNGIWDKKHNLPVIRKGITATHVKTKWNGKDEFLTDIASFPGSSGSPVFLVNMGSYIDNQGITHIGQSRIHLLGVHYAGAQHQADGTIEIVTVPTDTRPVPVTLIPNNIGVVINSQRILDFEPILAALLK
jgi:hypothetical protein